MLIESLISRYDRLGNAAWTWAERGALALTILRAMMLSASLAAGVFLAFWPALGWWPGRWYAHHWWHPLYEVDSVSVRKQLFLTGALWALLPAGYAFVWGVPPFLS